MSDLAWKRERLRRWGWVRVALGLPGLMLLLYFAGDVGAMGVPFLLMLGILAAPAVFGARMIALGYWASDAALTSSESLASVRLRGGVLGGMVVLFVGLAMTAVPACGCSTRAKAYHAAMKSDLKNLSSQQEIYFSDYLAYSADRAELGFVASNGVNVEVQAGVEGWTGKAWHEALGNATSCVMYFGQGTPVPETGGGLTPSLPGEIVCDE